MLDMGTTLFATIAILASILALHQPRWWYLVAASVGLGALQKGPIALGLAVAVVLLTVALKKWHHVSLASLRNRHFYVSAGIAVLLILSWPLIQSVQHGIHKVLYSYNREILERIAPGGEINSSGYDVIIGSEPWLRVAGIVALLCLPLVYRQIEFFALAIIFITFAAIMFISSGSVYSRYGLWFLPLLMASLAALLVGVPLIRMFCAIPVLVIAFWLGQPFKSSAELRYLQGNQSQYFSLLKDVSAMLQPAETFVVCGRHPIYPGAASYFASNGRPFKRVQSADDLEKKQMRGLSPPYRGLCLDSKFEDLKASLKSYSIVGEANGVVHWTTL